MLSYLTRRILYAIITLVGIAFVTFLLIHLVPGDPVVTYLGGLRPSAVPPEMVAAVRHEHHLDEPLLVQFGYWLRGVVTLDFGNSIVEPAPVRDRILQALPNTLLLNFAAFALALLIAIPLGFWTATTEKRPLDRGTQGLLAVLFALPNFWVALLLVEIFAVRLGLLPLYGMSSDTALTPLGNLADRLAHMVLPVATLTYPQIAIFGRFSRAALLEQSRSQYVTAARAKGLSPLAVIGRHSGRNALIPLISILSLSIPWLFSGSVIVERVFQWDGIGKLYIDSILSRDYPVVMALTVLTAVVTLIASVAADIAYAFADPRVRLEDAR